VRVEVARARLPAEAAAHAAGVRGRQLGRDERGLPALDAEHAGVHRRPGRERLARQAAREGGVELDGDHAARGARELGRQAPGAGAEVEGGVGGADARVAHELGRECRRAEEVPATRAGRCRR
jgi:hypothetical protein